MCKTMKKIFPQEIIDLSVETHFSKFNTLSQVIYLSVLALLLVSITSLFGLKTDITVLARGIFRSSAEPVQLIAPLSGEVIKTSCEENKLVKMGDTLIWLNNSKLMERILHIGTLIDENKAYLADIGYLLSGKPGGLTTALYHAGYSEHRQKLRELDEKTEFLRKAHERVKHLYSRRLVPATEMEDADYNLSRSVEEAEIYKRSRQAEWQKMAADYLATISRQAAEIREIEKEISNYYITAPFTGHIVHYTGVRPAGYVTAGQVIAVISPDGELVSEAYVLPKDIGYLNAGMDAIYQVDAYNHSLWGFASGKVIDISKEVYLMNNQPYFRVRSSLNESQLTLKNGYAGEFRKGFTATVRFKVTERTLAQLMFDKTDKWLNPQVIPDQN
jgi:membrane fusion protein, peptide pheromone/bacteriocin exporter